MADNFHFDLTGVSLELCLQVATTHHKAIGYREQVHTRGEAWGVQLPTPSIDTGGGRSTLLRPKPIDMRMILFWSDNGVREPINRFPAVMGPDELAVLIRAWLAERQYGSQPDHDGSNHKGWRIYNENWGHVNDEWQAFAAVEPVWLMYGK